MQVVVAPLRETWVLMVKRVVIAHLPFSEVEFLHQVLAFCIGKTAETRQFHTTGQRTGEDMVEVHAFNLMPHLGSLFDESVVERNIALPIACACRYFNGCVPNEKDGHFWEMGVIGEVINEGVKMDDC